MRGSPFSRAKEMMAMLAAAMAIPGMTMQTAIAGLGSYRSRGHGQGKITGKKQGNPGTDWKARMNSKRECARSRRQIAKGTLKVSGQ
jgi:hypothetical protein